MLILQALDALPDAVVGPLAPMVDTVRVVDFWRPVNADRYVDAVDPEQSRPLLVDQGPLVVMLAPIWQSVRSPMATSSSIR